MITKGRKGKHDGPKVTGVAFCGASQPHSFLSEQPSSEQPNWQNFLVFSMVSITDIKLGKLGYMSYLQMRRLCTTTIVAGLSKNKTLNLMTSMELKTLQGHKTCNTISRNTPDIVSCN
jgi:hypothetical protein